MARTITIAWSRGESVTGRLAVPRRAREPGVVLAHGAGAGQDHAFVVHIREGLAASGFPVLTFDYAYAERGARRPDPPGRLLAVHRAAVAAMARRKAAVVLAGKSMGGRIGSHLAAGLGPDGAELEAVRCAGLVYYGYPLVAPGKIEARSTEHLRRLTAPQLFLAGTRDQLGPLPVVKQLVGELAEARLAVIDGGDHSFRVPKRSGRSYDEVLDQLVAETVGFLEELGST